MKNKYPTIKCVTSNIYMQYTYYLKNQRKKRTEKGTKTRVKENLPKSFLPSVVT